MTKNQTTIMLGDCELTVDYYFDKGEKQIRYYGDLDGHPGTPPSVEIEKVSYKEIDVTDLLVEANPEIFEKLETKII